MDIIQVPKPPKSAWNPDRPVSTLLKSQIEHLSQAEQKLPHKYKSQIYIHAIKTEGEAAEYIRKVTAAIHKAHAEAAAARAKAAPKRRSGLSIAAVANGPRTAKKASAAKPTSKATSKATRVPAKKKNAAKSKSAAAKSGRGK